MTKRISVIRSVSIHWWHVTSDPPLVAIGRIPVLVAIGRRATLATDGMRAARFGTTLGPHRIAHEVLPFVVFARHFLFAAHLNLFDFPTPFPNLQFARSLIKIIIKNVRLLAARRKSTQQAHVARERNTS